MICSLQLPHFSKACPEGSRSTQRSGMRFGNPIPSNSPFGKGEGKEKDGELNHFFPFRFSRICRVSSFTTLL
jgi:hypothetical protein